MVGLEQATYETNPALPSTDLEPALNAQISNISTFFSIFSQSETSRSRVLLGSLGITNFCQYRAEVLRQEVTSLTDTTADQLQYSGVKYAQALSLDQIAQVLVGQSIQPAYYRPVRFHLLSHIARSEITPVLVKSVLTREDITILSVDSGHRSARSDIHETHLRPETLPIQLVPVATSLLQYRAGAIMIDSFKNHEQRRMWRDDLKVLYGPILGQAVSLYYDNNNQLRGNRISSTIDNLKLLLSIFLQAGTPGYTDAYSLFKHTYSLIKGYEDQQAYEFASLDEKIRVVSQVLMLVRVCLNELQAFDRCMSPHYLQA